MCSSSLICLALQYLTMCPRAVLTSTALFPCARLLISISSATKKIEPACQAILHWLVPKSWQCPCVCAALRTQTHAPRDSSLVKIRRIGQPKNSAPFLISLLWHSWAFVLKILGRILQKSPISYCDFHATSKHIRANLRRSLAFWSACNWRESQSPW